MQTTHRCAVGKRGFTLQPWELDHLRSGDEPARSDLWEFYLLYECGDWKIRWESVRERIVGEWLCMPEDQRPSDWIRYLVKFQYLSTEVGNLLLRSEAAPPRAITDKDPSAAILPI
jgi:hypothetical protein